MISPRRSRVCRAALPTRSRSSPWSVATRFSTIRNLVVETIRGAAHRQIWMNTREGDFTDKRIRQAIALGLDRQALIDTILKGKGDIANDHPIAPIYPFFDASQPQRERDIDKAKQLLSDAGKADLAGRRCTSRSCRRSRSWPRSSRAS